MIEKFPFEIISEHGYKAIITNPEKNIYHFDVKEPAHYPSFDWDELTRKNDDQQINTGSALDDVQFYLLHTFWALQRF